MNPLRNINLHSCTLAVCGLVLLGASALKAYTLATGPVAERDFLSSRWFLSAVAEGELVLGLALLTRFYPRVMQLVALAFFCIFLEVNLYLALSGRKDCLCFGRFTVSPWVMVAFDFFASVGLVLCKPWRMPARTVYSHPFFGLALMLLALLGIPSAIAMNQDKTGRVHPHLRRAHELQARLTVDAKNPNRQEILDRLSAATELPITVDKKLEDNEPSLGFVNLSRVPAFSLMEWLAQRQGQSHWKKVEGGYELTPLPWWHKISPWWLAFWILVAEAVGVFVFYCFKRRSATLRLAMQKA